MVSSFMGGESEVTDFMPSYKEEVKEREMINLKGQDLENFIFSVM